MVFLESAIRKGGKYAMTLSTSAGNKCDNHQCSQHCNPTTGDCYCDKTHTLDADGKTCVGKHS